MAPFIHFTAKNGEETFVNADHIVQAMFSETNGTLRIDLATRERGELKHTLVGEDATKALAVLRKLK
jgi:hypothetical protein